MAEIVCVSCGTPTIYDEPRKAPERCGICGREFPPLTAYKLTRDDQVFLRVNKIRPEDGRDPEYR